MSKLFLTNTLTKRKEEFVPADPRRVTMYVCGPTVYNYAHIGNGRPPVVFDVLFRLLRHLYGPAHVLYARNFTDVDDRIITASQETGLPIEEITAKFTAAYREDMAALGVLAPSFEPTATGHIQEMIALIGKLLDSGAAYRGQHGVWFSVAADADYGKLSGRSLEDMRAGASGRVDEEPDKRAPADFALWKAAKPGEPAWDAPFGAGRPGWHIECSAMIEKQLGRTIDIHAGGLDLIFPHHENEIAQSECAHGAPLARYWLHNGFLTMSSEKMSKSLGNVVTMQWLRAEGWKGEVLRYALLSAHYREPMDWNEGLLKQSEASLNRLYGALERVWDCDAAPAPPAAAVEALCDDLNTPKAIAELFALASAANKAESAAEKAQAKADLLGAGALLGVLQSEPGAWFKGEGEDSAIDALVEQRAEARRTKNWAEADRLRAELDKLGVVVMDDPKAGTSTWRRV